jgi:hypothetical protein
MTTETSNRNGLRFALSPEGTAIRLLLPHTMLYIMDAGTPSHRLAWLQRLDEPRSEQLMLAVENIPLLLREAFQIDQVEAWHTPAWAAPEMVVA